jgi:ligand-binding sensor domain-containing protein/signal transduction histidine kinase
MPCNTPCNTWARIVCNALPLFAWSVVLCVFFLSTQPSAQATSYPVSRWAQFADTPFQHISTDQGLPQSTATALAEDKDGFLWVGTQGGLARWDGYRFHVYQANPYDPHSLPDSYITILFVDQQGQLWIGTSSGGLVRYLPKTDQFQTISAGASGLSHVGVTALCNDGAGGLWVGTEAGLDHINAQQKVVAVPAWARSLPDMRVRGLLQAKDGALWVATRKGVLRVDAHGRSELLRFPGNLGTNVLVSSLMQASDGRIWVGTQDTGAIWFDDKLQAHALSLDSNEIERIDNIVEALPGVLWMGTNGQGIIVVDTRNFTSRTIRNNVSLPASLADNAIWGLLRDQAGLMWVATGRGVSRHAPLQQGVLTLFGVNGRSEGLSDNDVLGVLPVKEDAIWLVLGTRSLVIVNPDKKSISKVKQNLSTIFSIGTDPDGNVMIGTSSGLIRSDPWGKHFQAVALPRIEHTPGKSSPLRALGALFRDATSMLLERDKIWLGGINGLWRLDLDSRGNIVDWHPEVAGQLTDQRVSTLHHGADGKLFVGTDNGLNIVDTVRHTVERILPNRTDPTALAFGGVASILLDSKKRLWIGSLGGAISLLERRDADGRARFRRIGQEQGLPSGNANKLVEDAAGDIWVSTDEGIARINGSTLAVQALRRAEGVAIASYWANVGAVSGKNEILFGGAGGLTVVHPELLEVSQYRPPVRVTDMRIGGKQMPIALINSASPEGIQILPNANSFSFELAALDYSATERNRYAWRMEGYDKEWLEADATRRMASYANLPPGDYNLQFRGSNRNGLFGPDSKPILIRVLPAWHQTWWMRMIKIMLALLAVLAVVQARTYILRKRELELTEQVRARTAELDEKQQQLLIANGELAQTADTLRLMGDVGRDITANLEQDAVFEALYQHLAGLLEMDGMTIYQLDEDKQVLVCCFAREDERVLPQPTIALNSSTSLAARAVRERQEVLVDNQPDVKKPNYVEGTKILLTALFVPLLVGQRVLGAMSLQSAKAHAYGERERLIFRTVCAYGAIAFSNAQALDALHALQRQLMQQEKLASLGGLVAGVAHEVNTPLGNSLTAISGVIDIWRQQQAVLTHESVTLAELENFTNEGLEYAELAHRTARQAVEMVNSFKAIATPNQVDQVHSVVMVQYMQEVIALVRGAMEQDGGSVVLEIEPGLVLDIVPEALTEALARIFANVLNHAFPDHRPGQLRVVARRENGVLIQIIDNGCGIAPHDLPQVFDPFFSTKSGSGGHVGLGLHIAFNHIVQRLHGSIEVDSELGQGTTVTIRLPASCCVESASSQTSA